MTSRALQYCVLILACLSLASAATSGRHLLSDDDTDSGLLVTYWGQNSAAPTYQEPELDEVLRESICFTVYVQECAPNPAVLCRSVHSTTSQP